jgi:hypothetical protein
LRVKLAQNDSVAVPFREFTMEVSPKSIAGYVALSGEVVNIEDAYRLPEDVPEDETGSEVLGIWTTHIALLFGRELKAADVQTIYPAEQGGSPAAVRPARQEPPAGSGCWC